MLVVSFGYSRIPAPSLCSILVHSFTHHSLLLPSDTHAVVVLVWLPLHPAAHSNIPSFLIYCCLPLLHILQICREDWLKSILHPIVTLHSLLKVTHCCCFQVRRKDWLESMIHHIVTVFLLTYSYHVNFARVGVMIILAHDISDIFLEAAKLSR